MARILIADDLSEECAKILREGGLEVETLPKPDNAAMKARVVDADGLIVRSAVKVTKDVIEAGAKLRLIGRAGIGVDNIDVEAATRKGVIVMNTPQGNTTSAAEHALALILAAARNIVPAHARVSGGQWDRKGFTGIELEGKVLGVVGMGNIGSRVAQLARAFGMTVLAYDPNLTRERAAEKGAELVEFDALVERSDVVTLHCALNEKTRHLFDARAFKKMKPTARLVNAARGGIVDEAALAEALAEKRIAAAALDVFEKEPPDPANPLLKMPNVTVTPHLGASTEEARLKVAVDIAEQFVEFFNGGVTRNAVNAVSLADPSMAPYLRLAEDLASLGRQLVRGRVATIEIVFRGEFRRNDAAAIAASALKGFLAPVHGSGVNAVNAAYLVKERGIRVTETMTTDVADYRNLLTVKVGSDEDSKTVSGTVTEKGPSIVKLDGYDIDLRPAKYMVVMTYPDRPGTIGRFGTILGSHGINIARMEVGRTARGRQAVMILTVDDPVTAEVVEEIRKEIQVEDVRAVTLGG